MHRLARLTAAAIALSAFGPAEAATGHKARHHAQPPAVRQAPTLTREAAAHHPRWASPQQCYTEEPVIIAWASAV